jgi:hypothetical protein
MNQFEIVETIDGEYMILFDGFQWGPTRDRSGAGSATFKTRAEATLKVCQLALADK